MSLAIGRVGLANEYLNEVEAHTGSGAPGSTTVKLSGVIQAGTLIETIAMRDELVSQADYGAVIAVTWSEDSSIDGFYRVTSQTFNLRSLTDNGFIKFSTDLERLGAHPESALQSNLLPALRSNAHSITAGSAIPAFGVPNEPPFIRATPNIATAFLKQSWTVASPVTSGVVTPATASSIQVEELHDANLSGTMTSAADPIWSVPASEYYNGACEIYTAGVLRSGLSLPDSPIWTPPDWVLSNGLIRVAPSLTPGSYNFETRLFASSGAWESVTDWVLYYIGGSTVASFRTIEILRNDPEAAAVRLTTRFPSGSLTRWATIDLMVRRGIPIVYVTVSVYDIANAGTQTVHLRCNEASATITGGLQRSSDDADGNRWILLASGDTGPVTFNTTDGSAEYDVAASASVVDTVDFGVGYALDGASAFTQKNAQNTAYRYYAIVQERVVAVHR